IKDKTLELSFILNGQYFNYRRFQIPENISKVEFYEKEILPYFDKEITNLFQKIFLFSDALSSRAVREIMKISPITIELINPFKNCIINKTVLNSPAFNELNRFAPAVGIALRGI
ncbi:MAG: hypothetical protein N3A61_04915, partial [Ignavibacteria bacterium]|nr:hypothetical protein [Ignavibacteria bacterium]